MTTIKKEIQTIVDLVLALNEAGEHYTFNLGGMLNVSQHYENGIRWSGDAFFFKGAEDFLILREKLEQRLIKVSEASHEAA